MAEEEPSVLLDRLCREQGHDFATLSRMIGRNPAYIQQFIRRGSPRKLDEADRRILADFLGIDEAGLGGPAPGTSLRERSASAAHGAAAFVRVPRLDVGASAGPGATPGEEAARGSVDFDARWLRDLTGDSPRGLSIIRVTGDSMEPTLGDGDDILVDTGVAGAPLRDGIYVLRVDDTLIVKRLALNPVARSITIRSDNPRYPDVPDCDPAGVTVIGRVVWVGRRVR